MADQKGRKILKKSDIYSWLPRRETRNQARKKAQENQAKNQNSRNERRPLLNSTPVQDRRQARPTPQPNPNPIVPPRIPSPTPTPPVVPVAQNPKTPKRKISEILNELYTNPQFPTVRAHI